MISFTCYNKLYFVIVVLLVIVYIIGVNPYVIPIVQGGGVNE